MLVDFCVLSPHIGPRNAASLLPNARERKLFLDCPLCAFQNAEKISNGKQSPEANLLFPIIQEKQYFKTVENRGIFQITMYEDGCLQYSLEGVRLPSNLSL